MKSLFMRNSINIKQRTGLVIFLLAISLNTPTLAVIPPSAIAARTVFAGAKFYRTELYFGINVPGGGTVSEQEWNSFLNDEVTPKFPDGFTVLDGYGQWKNKEGKIVKEKSKVLIVLYPKNSFAEADKKIDEIRVAYNKAFHQQSVLRMDIVQTVRVSF
jgi:hypothetical protein